MREIMERQVPPHAVPDRAKRPSFAGKPAIERAAGQAERPRYSFGGAIRGARDRQDARLATGNDGGRLRYAVHGGGRNHHRAVTIRAWDRIAVIAW